MFTVARHVLRRSSHALRTPRAALHVAVARHAEDRDKEVAPRPPAPPMTLSERVASAKNTAQRVYTVGKKSTLLLAGASLL